MQRLGTLLRGMGTACLLVAIVLCQTVLAHDEARTASDRRLMGQRFLRPSSFPPQQPHVFRQPLVDVVHDLDRP